MVLGLLIVNNSYSNDRYLSEFEQWLYDNDHHQYLTLNEDNSKYKSNLNIKFYSSWGIPYKSDPNTDTLLYYLFKEITSDNNHGKIGSRGSDTPYEFEFDLRENKYVKKQMKKTALLSYLLYEDGKITSDEITPKDRFGIIFNNDTQWTSASMGKSLVSYVTGHAICEGYIDGVDARLNDWPLLENTLFYDQKLIDLLNMAAGDQRYAGYDLKTNKLGITSFSDEEYNLHKLLDNIITIILDEKEGIIQLNVDDENSQISSQIAIKSKLILQESIIDFKIKNIKAVYDFTIDQLEITKNNLYELQDSLAYFRDSNRNIKSNL